VRLTARLALAGQPSALRRSAPAIAQTAPDAQEQEAERRPPAQLAAVLAVEGRRVAGGVPARGVRLLPAGATAALAAPAHRRPRSGEPVAVAEQATAPSSPRRPARPELLPGPCAPLRLHGECCSALRRWR